MPHGCSRRTSERAGSRLDEALSALDRASIEIEGAIGEINALAEDIERDASGLEAVDARLHALRDAARKHSVAVDELSALRDDLAGRVALLEAGEENTAALVEAEREARDAYLAAADALTASRRQASIRLEAAIGAELPSLRLEQVRFAARPRTTGRASLVPQRPGADNLRGCNQPRGRAGTHPARGIGR